MIELLARQGPLLRVARDQGGTVRLVVGSLPQLPQGHRDVVEAVAEPAVVEVDEADVAALEERVVEMEVGVDQADRGPAVTELLHRAAGPGSHLVELRPQLAGNQVPASRRADAPVVHRVAEERLPVPSDPDEVLGECPPVGVVVQAGHGAAQPVQVDGAGRARVDPAIHPAQEGAGAWLVHAGG
jgi:hypothetical protein